MKKCPFCAEEIQEEAIVCRYCGRELPVTTPLQKQNKISGCPECHRVDKIEKVSAITQKGTHQIHGQIPVSNSYDSDGWKIGTNYESYSGTQQSTLARSLTPLAPYITNKNNSATDLFIDFIFNFFAYGVLLILGGIVILVGLSIFISGFIAGQGFLNNILRIFGGLGIIILFIGTYIWSRKNKKAGKQRQLETEKNGNILPIVGIGFTIAIETIAYIFQKKARLFQFLN